MRQRVSQNDQPQFNPLDRQFAEFICRISGGDAEIKLAAGLVSYARSLGHLCLDLQDLDPVLIGLAGGSVPMASRWISKLRESPVVGAPGEFKPLILDQAGRLYLHRYWEYETELAAGLQKLARTEGAVTDRARLSQGLCRLFPTTKPGMVNWQMIAAFAALRKRLCVISGGPGTGKTRTAVVLLALLLEQNPSLRIALAAPTGKAAARLQESVKQTKASLACASEIQGRLPEEASTIHRLLGTIQDSAYFRHNADNPLPVDVMVVDEASMVDLALMAKLTMALPDQARLVLLGDKDQLASVEAGAVLADLCGASDQRSYSKAFREELLEATGTVLPAGPTDTGNVALSDCVVELRENYRFGNSNAIYRLSQAVNDGNAEGALGILREAAAGQAEGVACRRLPAPAEIREQLRNVVLEEFGPYLREKEPVEALRLLAQFRILSPLRGGPYGTEHLNRLVEEVLREMQPNVGSGLFYPGRAIMVVRNDYNLKLFNGDIGVLLPDRKTGQLRAWFPAADGTARSLLPLRLPEHETAYVLTVHKSQGSEFRRVLLILPDEDSPVLTRELVYTGLTRARQRVELWHAEPVLRAAIQRKSSRRSGLRESLWGTGLPPAAV